MYTENSKLVTLKCTFVGRKKYGKVCMIYVQGHHSSTGVWPGFQVTIVMSRCSLLIKYGGDIAPGSALCTGLVCEGSLTPDHVPLPTPLLK